MRRFLNLFVTGTIGLSLICGVASAAKDKDKAAGKNVTVTGCLSKDAKEKNEFLISGEDGKTWGLKSRTVKLANHLNHKVTVTGRVTKEEHEKEAGDVNVTELKMVSESCK